MRRIKKIKHELISAGYPQGKVESVEEIYHEKYLMSESSPDTNMFDFRHHFGLGKTTFGLMNATCGDIFVSATHQQNKENEEHFRALRSENSLRIVGWEFAIGLNVDVKGNIIEPSDKQKELVPDRFQKHWNSKEVQELRQYTQDYGSNQGRLNWKIDNMKQDDDLPPILEEWSKQFSKESWKNNVIFCCSARIKQIMRRAWLGETDLVLLDEGVEESKPLEMPKVESIEGHFTSKQKTPDLPTGDQEDKKEMIAEELEKIENPDGRDYEEFDDLMYIPDHLDCPDTLHIDQDYLEKTVEMARKTYISIWKEATRGDKSIGETSFGQGLTEEFSELIPKVKGSLNEDIWRGEENRNHKTGEIYYQKGLERKWKGMAMSSQSDFDIEMKKILKDQNLSKDEKKKRLEWFIKTRKLINRLWDIRGTRLQYRRGSNDEVKTLKAEKPLMFYLWEIAESNNNDTEMWILDATAGKEYKENILAKRFQQHTQEKERKIREVDVSSCYLGDGNKVQLPNGEHIEFEDRSYENLKKEDLNVNYRRFHLEYNQDEDIEKESIPRKVLYKTDHRGEVTELTPTGKEVIRLIREERMNKGKIGVVTYKKFAEQINKFVEGWEDDQGNQIPVATWFAQSEGTNNYGSVKTLFVIGKPNPDWRGKMSKYLEDYRYVPEYAPKHLSSMRIVRDGALVGYRDEVDEAELHLQDMLDRDQNIDESNFGYFDTGTHWADFWKRHIANPVFDSYFRMRKQDQFKGHREIIRLGNDVKGFIGDTEGSIKDLISEKVSNRTAVEDWGEIEAKAFYSDREIINCDNKIKKPYKMYRAIEIEEKDVDVSNTTIWRYKKKWEEHLNY